METAMTIATRHAAPVQPHINGCTPRLNSTGCATYGNAVQSSGQQSSGAVRQPGEQRMNQELAERRQEEFAIIEQVVMQGDLSKLNPQQRVMYYNKVCASAGL